MSRQNYYILLELDPSVKDEAGIENAIKKKQAQWSSERNNPTKAVLAKQNLEELKNIRAVLLDPQARNEEAEAAKKEFEAIEKEKTEKLRRTAFIAVDNGEISAKDLSKLVQDFKLTEAEILKIINAKIKKEEVLTYKDDGIVPLEAVDKNNIKKDLDVVKKENLFIFLDRAKTSSCAELLKRADEIYNAASKNANKTAEITATVNLAGLCKKWFKDDSVKNRYEKTLRMSIFEDIYPLIDQAANDGIIEPHEYRKLMEACTDKGIKIDEAEYRIIEYCKKHAKKPVIQRSATAEYKIQVQCGFCGHLNDKAAVNCSSCGKPMKINCPKCGKEADSVSKACSGCGFSIGDMPNADPLMKEAKIELSRKNFAKARALLAEAEIFNPKHPDIEKIKTELNREFEIVKTINELFAAKRYIESQAKIAELKNINASSADIPKYEKKAEEQIAAANALCKKASAESNSAKKLEMFLSALDECSDYSAAITGASSVPVDPPSNLVVTKDKSTIILNWKMPADSRAVKYKIIRKENSAPTSPGDGTAMAETSGTSWRDEKAEFAKKYYYGVFSARGDSLSAVTAAKDPVVLDMDLEDVKKLKGTLSGGHIYLDWEFPNKCDSVKIDFSNSISQNAPVTTAEAVYTKDQYNRSKGYVLKNPANSDYHFTVYSRYKSDNQDYLSKGAKCVVINSEKINISYKVAKKGFFSKSACIRLESKLAPGGLPDIMVIAKRGSFPLTRQDGKCVMNINGAVMDKTTLDIDIPPQEIDGHQIRLFFAENNPKIEFVRSAK
jgi:hypothetical protein